jgi:hypothetical protein
LYSIVFQLNYVIRYLENDYLEWVVSRLRNLIIETDDSSETNDHVLSEIEGLIVSLVSELIAKGWSIKKLYELVREDLLQNHNNKYNEILEDFFKDILSKPKEYISLFVFESSPSLELQEKMQNFKLDLLDGTTVSSTYSDGLLSSHISPNKKYIRAITHSFDQYSAINMGWLKIIKTIDILRFYGYKIPKINKVPIVLGPDGRHFTRNVSVTVTFNKKKYKAPETILETIRAQMDKSNSETVNRKIRSLLEFSRIRKSHSLLNLRF